MNTLKDLNIWCISDKFKSYLNESLRSKFLKFLIAPKTKNVRCKVLMEFKRCCFGLSHNCSFCKDHIKTTEHLFYGYNFAKAFWDDFHYWLFRSFVNHS